MASDIDINYVLRYVGKSAARSVVGDNRAVRDSVDENTKALKEQDSTNKDVTKSTNAVQRAVDDAASSNRDYSRTHTTVQKETTKSKGAVDDFTKSLKNSNARFTAFGNLIKVLKWPAFVAGAGYAAQAISALTAGVVALSGALAPLTGALVAYPAILGSLGQAAGTAMLAFSGMGGAIKEMVKKQQEATSASGKAKTAIEKLTPAARSFARELVSLLPKLEQLKQVAGANLFPGVEKGLKSALPLFPRIQAAVAATGKVMGGLAEKAGRLVGSKAFGRDFTKVAEGNTKLLGHLGNGALGFAKGLENVMVAAQPFISWMGKGAEALGNWVASSSKAARDSGGLAKFFGETRGALEKVWRIVKPLGDALLQVMNAAKPLGNEILDSLGKGSEAIDKWTHSLSGKNALQEYFAKAKAPIYAMGRLVRDIAKDFLELGNQPGVAQLTEQVRTQLLPVLTELIGGTTKAFGPSLVKMLVQVGKLFGGIGGSSGPLVMFTDAVTRMLEAFNGILATVPGAKGLLVTFVGALAVGKAMKFVSALTGLKDMYGIYKKLIGFQRDYNTTLAGGDIAEGGVGAWLGKRGAAKKATTVAEGGAGAFGEKEALANAGLLAGVPGAMGRTGMLLKGVGIAGVGIGASQLAGSAVGGKAGSAISNIGTGAAAGAAIGSVVPVVGTAVGAGVGAGLGAIFTWRKQIVSVLGDVLDYTKKHALLIGAALSLILGPFPLIAAAVYKFHDQIVGALGSAFSWTKNAVGNLTKWVSNAFNNTIHFFTALPGRIVAGIKALPGLIANVLRAIPGLLGKMVGYWASLPFRIGALVFELQKKVVTIFIEMVPKVATAVARLVSNVVSAIGHMVSNVVNRAGDLVSKLPGVGLRAMKALANAVSNGAQAVWSFFKALPGRVVSFLGSGGNGLAGRLLEAGKNGIKGLISGMKSAASGLWSWFSGIPGHLLSLAGKMASQLADAGAKFAKEFAKGFFEALPGPVKGALGKVGEGVSAVKNFGEGLLPARGGVVQRHRVGSSKRQRIELNQGGPVGEWGAKGYDAIPALLAPGEVVLTHHHQSPINVAVENEYGMSLPQLVEGMQTPHHYDKGGVVGVGPRSGPGRHPAAGLVLPDIAAKRSEFELFKSLGVPGFAKGSGGVGGASRLSAMVTRAAALSGTPYPHPDQHFGLQLHPSFLDCSAAVSNVLWAGGLLSTEEASPALESWGAAGKSGNGMTVYANTGHAWMELLGKPWGTSVGDNGAGGLGYHSDPGAAYKSQFRVRHYPGSLGSASSGATSSSAAGVKEAKPFYAKYSLPTWKLQKNGRPIFGTTSSYKEALSAIAPHTPAHAKGGKGTPTANGKTYTGKVSWFNGGPTAGGSNTSRPGIAMNINPGTESGWENPTTNKWMAMSNAGHPQFAAVTIAGKTANLPITDKGPAGFTQRAIDVTEGGVKKLGLSLSSFPTDSIGKAQLLARGGVAGRRGRAGGRKPRRFASGGTTFSPGPIQGAPLSLPGPVGPAMVAPRLPAMPGVIKSLLSGSGALPAALKSASKTIDAFGIYKTASIVHAVQSEYAHASDANSKKALAAILVTSTASFVADIGKASGDLQMAMIHKASEAVTRQIQALKKGGVTQPEQHILQSLYNQRSDLISMALNNAGDTLQKGGPAAIQETLKKLQHRITGIRKGGTTGAEGKLIHGIQALMVYGQNRVLEIGLESQNLGVVKATMGRIIAKISALRKGGVTPKERSAIHKLQGYLVEGSENIYGLLAKAGNVAALEGIKGNLQAKLTAIAKGGITKGERAVYATTKKMLESTETAIKTAVEVQQEQLAAAVEAAAKTAETSSLHTQSAETGLETLELNQKLKGTYDTKAGGEARANYLRGVIIPDITKHITDLQGVAAKEFQAGDNNGFLNTLNEIQQEGNRILQDQLTAQEATQQATEETAEVLSQAAGSLGFSFNGQNFTDLIGLGVGT